MLDEREFRRWLHQAEQTLRAAEWDEQGQFWNWACFKAEQAAHYAVKGLLRALGVSAFGHSLHRLMQQEERIATARTYAERLRQRLGALTVWLYGSVAQGTFKDWSDIDAFIVAETLPSHPLQRNDLLYQDAPIGVEPKGWTKAEFERGLAKRDPALLAMLKDRIVLVDDLNLEDALRHAEGDRKPNEIGDQR